MKIKRPLISSLFGNQTRPSIFTNWRRRGIDFGDLFAVFYSGRNKADGWCLYKKKSNNMINRINE